MGCNTKCWLIAGSVIGGLLAILGGILIPVGDIIIKGEIDKEAAIEDGTIAYENWIVPGSPVYRQFWIFNVSNPDDIINGGKPKLQQMGPYTYLVRYADKSNVTQNNNNTVTFFQPNVALFQRDMSIGPDDDYYTVLNLAVAAAPGMIDEGFLFIVNQAIKTSNSSLFQTRSVKEILWGYIDPFLEKIPNFIIADKTTGVFYPYNETNDGPYVVNNGKGDISKVALIDRYRGERTLSYWKDNYCDMLNGTDAASFPPGVDKNVPLYFFSSEICRSIYGLYEKEYKLEGIKLYRFVLPEFALASPYDNPDNHCFCTDKIISRNCNASGVLDLRACQGGKPIFLSLPHFLYASDFLLESLEGLSPNVEEHQTYVDVEPITGFTMHFAKRLQVNVFFNRTSRIDLPISNNAILQISSRNNGNTWALRELQDSILSKLQSEFMFPVVWLNETATIGKDKANIFKASVTTPMNALGFIQIVFLCVGIVIFLSCSIALCIRSRSGKKGKS